jgi:hypothetical protein
VQVDPVKEGSMSKGVLVRFLVPQHRADGTVTYQMAAQWIRLPLKREDRLALMERLGGEDYLAR